MQACLQRAGCWLWLTTALFLIVSGIDPNDRFVWALEISWVVLGLVIVAVLDRRRIAPSRPLQWAMFVHAVLLIYGGWYTYELVPLGEWLRELGDFERNHYDRIGHFAQGFAPALLYRELYRRAARFRPDAWLELVVFCTALAFSAFFELLEFAAAMLFGDASAAYLGSQGDSWDAQWDMAYCAIGALCSIALLRGLHLRALRRSPAVEPRASRAVQDQQSQEDHEHD